MVREPFTEYYIVGSRPVKLIKNEKGELGSYVFDWNTGEFALDIDYVSRIYFTHDDIEEVSREKFDEKVHELREELRKRK